MGKGQDYGMKSPNEIQWLRNSINPLAIIQSLCVGIPVLWLVFVSFRHWHFADSPTGFTFTAYSRLIVAGPARSAMLATLCIVSASAVTALAVGAPVSLYAVKRPKGGFLVLVILIALSYVATPVRGEAWRNVSIIFGLRKHAWVAFPAMLNAVVPFAALLLYLGARDLQRRDLELGKIQGIPRTQRYARIWGVPLAKAIMGTWFFCMLISLSDLGTPSELYQGSKYLLADELRSRVSVQAWSDLAGDSSVIVVISACMVVSAALFLKGRIKSRHTTFESGSPVSLFGFFAVIPAVVIVLAPIIGLLLGSISDHELLLSFKQGGTFRWWREGLSNSRVFQAFYRSLSDAFIALGIGIPLGIAGAVFDWRRQIGGQRSHAILYALWFLPWLVSPVAFGMAASLLCRRIGLSLGLVTMAVFHALFVAPVVAAFCRARLNRISPYDIELASVLGISTQNVLIRVVLPEIGAAVLLAAMVGGAIVCSEVSFAELMCGVDETLPVMLRGMSRSGGTPVINVIGMISVVIAGCFVIAVLGLARLGHSRRS